MAFDPLAPEGMATMALLAMRVSGVVLIAPVLSSRTVPARLKSAMVLALTLALLPAALAGAGAAPRLSAASLLSEWVVGFAVGIGAAVFVGAAELAGDLISVQSGLSGASALDPISGLTVPTLGQFMSLFAITLILSLGGDGVILDALADSLRRVPLGAPIEAARGFGAVAGLGTDLFALGLRFAAPVVAAVLVSYMALGVLAKAAPQLNILALAYGVQIAVGLAVLAFGIPYLAAAFAAWPDDFADTYHRLIGAFGGRP